MSDLICCLVRDPAAASAPGVLDAIARACSPRVAPFGADVVVFDVAGLQRIVGAPADIAREVRAIAAAEGVRVRLAVADTMTSAWLLAHAHPDATVAMGADRVARLATLPISVLAVLPELAPAALAAGTRDGQPVGRMPQQRESATGQSGRPRRRPARHYRMAPGPDVGDSPARGRPAAARVSGRTAVPAAPVVIDPGLLATFERWGLRTLGDLARLPRAGVRARLGPPGVRLHQAATGEDVQPLVPAGDAPRFVERFELEWPVEGLEPLSFVLARLCDALSIALERADRGAVDVTTSLWLVTRAWHRRTLHLPAAMRDARVLRTLILLDLESHPPPAAIDVVEVEAGVTPGRISQGSLLDRTLPRPEDLATLLARLRALMGESRVGAPALVDTHDDRAVAMAAFAVVNFEVRTSRFEVDAAGSAVPLLGLRRFRLPIAARVIADRGMPSRVWPSARHLPGGEVAAAAGPWRSSGHWWSLEGAAWDRDEWDVEIRGGPVYRVARDRASGHWSVEGLVD